MLQLGLTFDPGLAQKYRDMRECFAACVYSHGLTRVAGKCDVAASNLSTMLSGERHLDPSLIESYMREFGDTTPALFWAARWLQDAEAIQKQAMASLPALVEQLQRALAATKA